MSRDDPLVARFPELGASLARVELANLPTPVRHASLHLETGEHAVWIKADDVTSELYGGNKIRKLEYLLGRALQRRRKGIATFGATGSNHALATAVFARATGLKPTCFLSHQTRTPLVEKALRVHLGLGTHLVEFGGDYPSRLKILRQCLWNADTEVIPLGGSSWVGTVGFVAAGLELAEQMNAQRLPRPDRIYIASGTLGSAAGLALGLAAGSVTTEVHAIRVSHRSIANAAVLERLLYKTTYMLGRLSATFPADLAGRARIVLRDGYFAPGYAHSNPATDDAIRIADEQLGLTLEATYTGKAMAALIDDLRAGDVRGPVLFWNTYNSAPLAVPEAHRADLNRLPDAFSSYLD